MPTRRHAESWSSSSASSRAASCSELHGRFSDRKPDCRAPMRTSFWRITSRRWSLPLRGEAGRRPRCRGSGSGIAPCAAFRLVRERLQPAASGAVRRGHERFRPALRRAARPSRTPTLSRLDPSPVRLAPAWLLRERGVPHQLLVTTSYDLALRDQRCWRQAKNSTLSHTSLQARTGGSSATISLDGTGRLIDLPNTYATRAFARGTDCRSSAARAGRPRPRA